MLLNHLCDARTCPNSVLSLIRKSFSRVMIEIVDLVEVEPWVPRLEIELNLVLSHGFQVCRSRSRIFVPESQRLSTFDARTIVTKIDYHQFNLTFRREIRPI